MIIHLFAHIIYKSIIKDFRSKFFSRIDSYHEVFDMNPPNAAEKLQTNESYERETN